MINPFRLSIQFSAKKILATVLAGVLFYEVGAMPLAEASQYKNIWNDRRKNQTQLASAHIVEQLPRVGSSLPKTSEINSLLSPINTDTLLSASLRSLINAVPLLHGTVKQMYDPKNSDHAPVVLLQDVHLNSEAQTNLVSVLESLIDEKKIDLVGVEGAFGSFDFSPFHAFPDASLVKEVSFEFLSQNKMGAPSYVGITTRKGLPLFVGIDDEKEHEANVQAYLTTRNEVPSVLKKIEEVEVTLDEKKSKTFSPVLSEFDSLRRAYVKNTIGLGSYLKKLVSMGVEADFVVDRFLMAYEMESKIDFNRVEQERRAVVEKLLGKLNDQEINDLLVRSAAYRSGRLNYGSYYGELKNLCTKKGLDLRQTPAFDNYVRYVLLADGIPADELFERVADLEKSLAHRIAVTPQQKSILQDIEYLGFARKLVKFELTPNEWARYVSLRAQRSNLPSQKLATQQKIASVDRMSDLLRNGSLGAFEKFYTSADERSRIMVSKLLEKKTKKGAVLIAGGYHTPEIFNLLKEKKIPVVVVSPKLTKVSDEDGSAYLSVFAREKTPLDRLFAGEKLFVNDPALVVGSGAKAQEGPSRLARATMALRTLLRIPGVALSPATGVIVQAFNSVKGQATLSVDGVVVLAQSKGVGQETFKAPRPSLKTMVVAAIGVIVIPVTNLGAWIKNKYVTLTKAPATWTVRGFVGVSIVGLALVALFINPNFFSMIYHFADVNVLNLLLRGVSPAEAINAMGDSLTYSRALVFPILIGLAYKFLFSVYGYVYTSWTNKPLLNQKGQAILHLFSGVEDYKAALQKHEVIQRVMADKSSDPQLKRTMNQMTLGELRGFYIALEKQSDALKPQPRGKPKTFLKVFLNMLNPLHLMAFFKSFFFSSYLNQISYSLRGQYESFIGTDAQALKLVNEIAQDRIDSGFVRSSIWLVWKQDIFLVGAVQFFLKRVPMMLVSAAGGALFVPAFSWLMDLLIPDSLGTAAAEVVESGTGTISRFIGNLGSYGKILVDNFHLDQNTIFGSFFNALGLQIPRTFSTTLRSVRSGVAARDGIINIRKQKSARELVFTKIYWKQLAQTMAQKSFYVNLVDSIWGMLTLNAEIAVALQISSDAGRQTGAQVMGIFEGHHNSAMSFGHDILGLASAVISTPHSVITQAPVHVARETLAPKSTTERSKANVSKEDEDREPSRAGVSRLGIFLTALAAIGSLLEGQSNNSGEEKQNPGSTTQQPGQDPAARLSDTAKWIEDHLGKNGFPLANSGDPALRDISFLYDVMQRVNLLVMEGKLEDAKTLYFNATIGKNNQDQFLWRRNYGGPARSINVETGVPFEADVKNGVTLHVANTGLNLWAALGGSDSAVYAVAKDAFDHVKEQREHEGWDGSVPHGPPAGAQRFDDGVRYQDIFTPEYQIDFYRPAQIFGQLTGDESYTKAAEKALDYLVQHQYKAADKKFFAKNDQGQDDSPPDAPAWALSMIGPDKLAEKGVDVLALIRDMGTLPADFFRTEFLAMRMVALQNQAIPYLRSQPTRTTELLEAQTQLTQLRNLLFNLPLQSSPNGGGWADGYRRVSAVADPTSVGAWEPAEGVNTGWGWTTQRGSSLNAATYALFFGRGFDPVAGRGLNQPDIDWNALRARVPASASDASRERVYEFGAGGDSTIFGSDVYRRVLQDAHRAEQLALAKVMVSPGFPGVPNYTEDTKVTHGWDQMGASPDELVKLESNTIDPQNNDTGPFAAINFRNKLSEQKVLIASDGSYYRVGEDRISNSEGLHYNYFVFNTNARHPSEGIKVVKEFFYLTESEKNQNPIQGHENDPSVEAWLGNAPPSLDLTTGLSSSINPTGDRVGRYSNIVLLDGVSGDVSSSLQSHLTPAQPLQFVFKIPIDEAAREYDDNLKRTDPEKYRQSILKHDEHFVWIYSADGKYAPSVDMRVVRANLPPEKSETVVISPQYAVEGQNPLIYRYGNLYLEGLSRGMVIRPDPNLSFNTSSRIHLRPDLVGDRTFLNTDPFLTILAQEKQNAGTDAAKLNALDNAYREWRLMRSWLADMQAYLEQRSFRIARGLYRLDSFSLSHLTELPTLSGLLTEIEQAKTQYQFDPRTGKFPALAITQNVHPRVSEYEQAVWEFNDYLVRLQNQIEKESNPAKRNALIEQQRISLHDLTWEGNALIPGNRQAQRDLVRLQNAVGLNGPAALRNQGQNDAWAFPQFETTRLPIPLEEQYKEYRNVFSPNPEITNQPPLHWLRVKSAERVAWLDAQNSKGEWTYRVEASPLELKPTTAGSAWSALDRTPLPLPVLGQGETRQNDVDTTFRGQFTVTKVIRDNAGKILREEKYSVGDQQFTFDRFGDEFQRLIDDGKAQIIKTTIPQVLRPTEISVTSPYEAAHRLIYSKADRNDPDTKLLEKEIPSTGRIEKYTNHKFNPFSGTWIPTRVEVSVNGEQLETRDLVVDDRGDPVFGEGGAVQYNVVRLVRGVPVERLLETTDFGGNLVSSFDKRTKLLTTFDAEREDEMFRQTGIRIHVPLRAERADDTGHVVAGVPVLFTYTFRFPVSDDFTRFEIVKTINPDAVVAGITADIEREIKETWVLTNPGNGDIKHRLVESENSLGVTRHEYTKANRYDKPSQTQYIPKINGTVAPADRYTYRDTLRINNDGTLVFNNGGFVTDRSYRDGRQATFFENEAGQNIRWDEGPMTTINKNFIWDLLSSRWVNAQSFAGATDQLSQGNWEQRAISWTRGGTLVGSDGNFNWSHHLHGDSVWTVNNPLTEQTETRTLDYSGVLAKLITPSNGSIKTYDVARERSLKNIWGMAVELPLTAVRESEPNRVLVRFDSELDAGAFSGETFTYLTIKATNQLTRQNNVVTTRMEVKPLVEWWRDDLLNFSQLRPVEIIQSIPMGESRTKMEYNNQNVSVRQVKTFYDQTGQLVLDATESTETTLQPNGRPLFETVTLGNGQAEVSSVQTQTSLQQVMKDNVNILGRTVRRFEGRVQYGPTAQFTPAVVSASGDVTPGHWNQGVRIDWRYVTEIDYAKPGGNADLDRFAIAFQSPQLVETRLFATEANGTKVGSLLESGRWQSSDIDDSTGEPLSTFEHAIYLPNGTTENYSTRIVRNRWNQMVQFFDLDNNKNPMYVTVFTGLTNFPGFFSRAQKFSVDSRGQLTGSALSESSTPSIIEPIQANSSDPRLHGRTFPFPVVLSPSKNFITGEVGQIFRTIDGRVVLRIEGRVNPSGQFIPEIWRESNDPRFDLVPFMRPGVSTEVRSGYIGTINVVKGDPNFSESSYGRLLGMENLPQGVGLIGKQGSLTRTEDGLLGTIVTELRDGPGKIAIRYDSEKIPGKNGAMDTFDQYREAHYDYVFDIGRPVPPEIAHRITIKENGQIVRVLDFDRIDENGFIVYKVAEEKFLFFSSRLDKLEYGLTYVGYGPAGRTFEDHEYASNPRRVRIYSKYSVPIFSTTSEFEGQEALYKIYTSRVLRDGEKTYVYAEMKTPPEGMGQRGIFGEFYRRHVELPLENEDNDLYGPTWAVIVNGRHLYLQDGWKTSEDIQQLTQYSIWDHFKNSLFGRLWAKVSYTIPPGIKAIRDYARDPAIAPSQFQILDLKGRSEIPDQLVNRTAEQIRQATWGEVGFLFWNYLVWVVGIGVLIYLSYGLLLSLINWGYWQKYKSINFNRASVSDIQDLRIPKSFLMSLGLGLIDIGGLIPFPFLKIKKVVDMGLTLDNASALYQFRKKNIAFKNKEDLLNKLRSENPELAAKVEPYLSRLNFYVDPKETNLITEADISSLKLLPPPADYSPAANMLKVVKVGEFPPDHLLAPIQNQLRDYLKGQLLTVKELSIIFNRFADVLDQGLMTREQVVKRILAEATKKALWEKTEQGMHLKPRFERSLRLKAKLLMRDIGLKDRDLLSGLAFNSDQFIEDVFLKDVSGLTFDFEEIEVDPAPIVSSLGVRLPVNRTGEWHLGTLEDSLLRKIIRKAIPFAAGQTQFERFILRELYFMIRDGKGADIPEYLERQRSYWYDTMKIQLAKLETLRDLREAGRWEYVFTWEEVNDFFRYLQGETDFGAFPKEWESDEELISLRIHAMSYLEILRYRKLTDEETRVLIYDIAKPLIDNVRKKLGIVKIEKPMTQAEFTFRGIFLLLTHFTVWKRFVGDNSAGNGARRRSIKTAYATGFWIMVFLVTALAVLGFVYVVYIKLDLIPISWSFKELGQFFITDFWHAAAKGWVLLVLGDAIISLVFSILQIAKAIVVYTVSRHYRSHSIRTWKDTQKYLPRFLVGEKNEFNRINFQTFIDDLIAESDMTSEEAKEWQDWLESLQSNKNIPLRLKPKTKAAEQRMRSWVNSQNRADKPLAPQKYEDLASITVQHSGWEEVLQFNREQLWDKGNEFQLEHRLGMVARAYKEKWMVLLAELLSRNAITEGQYEFLKKIPENPDRPFEESGLVKGGEADGAITKWANNRLGIGVKTLNGALKIKKVYEQYIIKFFPEAKKDPRLLEKLVNDKVQFITKHDHVAQVIDTALNYQSLDALLKDLRSGKRDVNWAVWRVGEDLGVGTQGYLESLLSMSSEELKIELEKNNSTAKKIQDRIYADGLGKLLRDRKEKKVVVNNDEELRKIITGIDLKKDVFIKSALTDQQQLIEYIKYFADNNIELQWWKKDVSDVHLQAKYTQWANFFSQVRGELTLALDWDHEILWEEASNLPHAGMEYKLDPKLGVSPYQGYIFTKPISRVGAAMATAEEAWLRQDLRAKQEVGLVGMYGKALFRTQFARDLEFLQEEYVAEDMVGALRETLRGMHTKTLSYVNLGKGLSTSYMEALTPLRKWSGDSPEIIMGATGMKFLMSPNLHWTKKVDTLMSLGFYYKKPRVVRFVTMLAIFHYAFPGNPLTGLSLFFLLLGMFMAQAISYGALFNYIEDYGFWKGAFLMFPYHMITLLMPFYIGILPHYSDSVQRGFRKGAKFIATGGKGGPLNRTSFGQLYIDNSYSITRGGYLLILTLLSPFDPFRGAIWGFLILTMIYWFSAPFIFNPETKFGKRFNFFIGGMLLTALVTWGVALIFGLSLGLVLYTSLGWLGLMLLYLTFHQPRNALQAFRRLLKYPRQNLVQFGKNVWETNTLHIIRAFGNVVLDLIYSIIYFPLGLLDKLSGGNIYNSRLLVIIVGFFVPLVGKNPRLQFLRPPRQRAIDLWKQFLAYKKVPELKDHAYLKQIDSLAQNHPFGLKAYSEGRMRGNLSFTHLRMMDKLNHQIEKYLEEKSINSPAPVEFKIIKEHQSSLFIRIIDIIPLIDWVVAFFPKPSDLKISNKFLRFLAYLVVLPPWPIILAANILFRIFIFFSSYVTGMRKGIPFPAINELRKIVDTDYENRARQAEAQFVLVRPSKEAPIHRDALPQLIDYLKDSSIIIRRATRNKLESLQAKNGDPFTKSHISDQEFLNIWTNLLDMPVDTSADIRRQGVNGLADLIEKQLRNPTSADVGFLRNMHEKLLGIIKNPKENLIVRHVALYRIYLYSKLYTQVSVPLGEAIYFDMASLTALDGTAQPMEGKKTLDQLVLRRNSVNVVVSAYYVQLKNSGGDRNNNVSASAKSILLNRLEDPDDQVAKFTIKFLLDDKSDDLITGAFHKLKSMVRNDQLSDNTRIQGVEALAKIYQMKNLKAETESRRRSTEEGQPQEQIEDLILDLLLSGSRQLASSVAEWFIKLPEKPNEKILEELIPIYRKWSDVKKREDESDKEYEIILSQHRALRLFTFRYIEKHFADIQADRNTDNLIMLAFRDSDDKIRSMAIHLAKVKRLPSSRRLIRYIAMLSSSIPGVRLDAVKGLHEMQVNKEIPDEQSSRVLELLENRLGDGWGEVRFATYEAIEKFSLSEADKIKMWTKAFKNGTGYRSREKALRELHKLALDTTLGDKLHGDAVAGFNLVFNEKHWPDIIKTALKLLGEKPLQESKDYLFRILKSSNVELQINTVPVLVKYAMEYPDFRLEILNALKDQDNVYYRPLRFKIILALGELVDLSSKDMFMSLMAPWRTFPTRFTGMKALQKLLEKNPNDNGLKQFISDRIGFMLADKEVVIRQAGYEMMDKLSLQVGAQHRVLMYAMSHPILSARRSDATIMEASQKLKVLAETHPALRDSIHQAFLREKNRSYDNPRLQKILNEVTDATGPPSRISGTGSFLSAGVSLVLLALYIYLPFYSISGLQESVLFFFFIPPFIMGVLFLVLTTWFYGYLGVHLWISHFLALSGRVRGGPSRTWGNLISEFKNENIVNISSRHLAYVKKVNGQNKIFANKIRLSYLSPRLQKLVYAHEMAHMEGKGELKAYWVTLREFLNGLRTIKYPVTPKEDIPNVYKVNVSPAKLRTWAQRTSTVLSDLTTTRSEREERLISLISDSPLPLGLDIIKRSTEDTGLVEANLLDLLVENLWKQDNKKRISDSNVKAQPLSDWGAHLWSHLRNEEMPEGKIYFAGSLRAHNVRTNLGLQNKLVYHLLKNEDNNLLGKVNAQLDRIAEYEVYYGFVVESERDRSVVQELINNKKLQNKVHVVVRTRETTLKRLEDMSIAADPKIAGFFNNAFPVEVFFEEGLEVSLPSDFFDIDEEWKKMYRFFLIITDTLNPVAVELTQLEFGKLDELDNIARLIRSQA